MTFLQFLDATYRLKLVDIEKNGFSVQSDAEAKVAQTLISRQHKFYRWVYPFKLITLFFLVKLKLVKAPISPFNGGKGLKGKGNAEVLPDQKVQGA